MLEGCCRKAMAEWSLPQLHQQTAPAARACGATTAGTPYQQLQAALQAGTVAAAVHVSNGVCYCLSVHSCQHER
jgi:hypothetical protein